MHTDRIKVKQELNKIKIFEVKFYTLIQIEARLTMIIMNRKIWAEINW